MKIALTVIALVLILPLFLFADEPLVESQKTEILNEVAAISDGEKGACGDADNSGMTTVMDIIFLYNHVFGATAPSPYSSGNVDAACRINVADVCYLSDYVYGVGPSPSCTDTVQCNYSTSAGNGISIGCGPYTPYGENDSVAIPIYIDNNTGIRALSLGFHYPSTNIEITSVVTAGSVVPGTGSWKSYFDATGNRVAIGWCASFGPAPTSLSPQTGGLLATLNARILSGPVDQDIELDSVFVGPGAEFMFLTSDGSSILPEFEPCAPYVPLEVQNLQDEGENSLRWAIGKAATDIGPDTIIFSVSGFVDLVTALPEITDDETIILGETAPGGAHSVIIDGSSMGAVAGLALNSDYNEIRGLTITGWNGQCIAVNGNNNTIADCHINVNEDGDTRVAGSGDGILLTGNYNTVGGCTAGDRNLAAGGNTKSGILISTAKFNTVVNNYVGLTADGSELFDPPSSAYGISLENADSNYVGDTTCLRNFFSDNLIGIRIFDSYGNKIMNNVVGLAANVIDVIANNAGIAFNSVCRRNIIGPYNLIAGNTTDGIYMPIDCDSNVIVGNNIIGNTLNGIMLTSGAKDNRIGGYTSGEKNIIARNESGIYIYGNSDYNSIIGNRIGGDAAHVSDGNRDNGITIDFNCDNNLVDSNTIGYNTNDGVAIVINSRLNQIIRNSIYENGDLAIDLADDGVTTNDAGDGDSGPNDLLNYPVVDSVVYDPADSTFNIFGIGPSSARVEFFVAHPAEDETRAADPSGHGEAYQYMGYVNAPSTGGYTYKASRNYAMFSTIAITATSLSGNTSEFSSNVDFSVAPLIIVAYSPVNLKVIDPVGDSIGKDPFGTVTQSITDATYDEAPNDSITITYPLEGTYIIIVITEDGAPPGATYGIGIRIDGSVQCILVENAVAPAAEEADTLGYEVMEGYHYKNGDANDDSGLNLLDILCIIDCLYGDEDEDQCCPDPIGAGDANCDLMLNLIDILYLIDHLYGVPPGPAPCPINR